MRSVRELAWGMWGYKGGGDGIEGGGDNGASCRDWGEPKKSLRLQEPCPSCRDWGEPKKSLRLQEPLFVCLFICLSKGSDGKESPCNARPGFNTWIGKIPWRRAWQPLQYSCLENPHKQRSLAGCSPWGHKSVRHDWVTKHSIAHTQFWSYVIQKQFWTSGNIRKPHNTNQNGNFWASVIQFSFKKLSVGISKVPLMVTDILNCHWSGQSI